MHIRYEDALTCAPHAFACGLTVEALSAESCDANWQRGFTLLTDADGCSFKLLELQQLAVYWDPMPVPGGMFANCNFTELTVSMLLFRDKTEIFFVNVGVYNNNIFGSICDTLSFNEWNEN